MKRLATACLLAACAAAPMASAQTADAPTKVVFLRECAEPSAFKVAIFVDGDRKASLANHTYAVLDLKPGSHQIAIDWPAFSGQIDLEGEIEVTPAQTNYVYVQAFARVVSGNMTKMYSAVGQINADDALKAMADIDAKGARRIAYCRPPASFYELPMKTK